MGAGWNGLTAHVLSQAACKRNKNVLKGSRRAASNYRFRPTFSLLVILYKLQVSGQCLADHQFLLCVPCFCLDVARLLKYFQASLDEKQKNNTLVNSWRRDMESAEIIKHNL